MTDYVCHNCFEALSYTGPRDNGSETDAFALYQDGTLLLFCSEACANWWDDIIQPGPMLGKEITVAEGEPVV